MKCEVFLKMGRAQNFELQCGNCILIDKLLEHKLSSFDTSMTGVVSDFLGVEDVEAIVILLLNGLVNFWYDVSRILFELVRLIWIN